MTMFLHQFIWGWILFGAIGALVFVLIAGWEILTKPGECRTRKDTAETIGTIVLANIGCLLAGPFSAMLVIHLFSDDGEYRITGYVITLFCTIILLAGALINANRAPISAHLMIQPRGQQVEIIELQPGAQLISEQGEVLFYMPGK